MQYSGKWRSAEMELWDTDYLAVNKPSYYCLCEFFLTADERR
jgi:hypothetical protein